MATYYGAGSGKASSNIDTDPSLNTSTSATGGLLDYFKTLQSKVSTTPQKMSFSSYSNSQGLNPYANKKLAKQYQKDSYLLQIQGIQYSQNSVKQLASANALKQQKELDMALADAAKQFSQISSSQMAQAGASGLSVYSGSFIDVFADQASQFTTQVQRAKDATRLNQETLMREALYQAESYNYDIKGIQTQITLNDLMIE